ncbi:MAG: ATP-dependent 6-phosphofructokinase [Syntrophales bacterium]|nr:ATP-dependent 6-phosphofructokinase [Syntrophales bacterium]MDY0043553.1 ATP-dependent 6-phosphofructokinase [Syntrophales bacterium]
MARTTKRIGILTGGGDCPGLNPAIKWVVNTALDERTGSTKKVRFEVLGIREGWRGLSDIFIASAEDCKKYTVALNEDVVRTWDRFGGTMLGTSRTNPFDPGNDRSEQLLYNLQHLNIDYLVAIGGEDTLGVAHTLNQMGIKVIGIPKTIDNDLMGTDYSLGFESAVQIITEEIDRLRTTAGSHKRIFVVETMGRHSGWLALEGGEASGAYIILIPEYDFEVERIKELVEEGVERGHRYAIIVVAEGAKPKGSDLFVRSSQIDGFGHVALGGIGEFLACKIEKDTGLETRSVVLSHLQRGGTPTSYDRRMGRYFAIAAVDLILKEDFDRMVSYQKGIISSVPLKEAVGKTKKVNIKRYYDTKLYNGTRTMLLDHLGQNGGGNNTLNKLTYSIINGNEKRKSSFWGFFR